MPLLQRQGLPFSPKQLFYQVNMCHDHSPTAVSFATQLVHSVSVKAKPVSHKVFTSRSREELSNLPIRDSIVKEGEITFPKVAYHLFASGISKL
jgi:hypothetical protein